MVCPLCNSSSSLSVSNQTYRDFYKCNNCWLIFINPADLPSNTDEKTRYDLHKNADDDKGYIDFLNKAMQPTLPYLNSNMAGLDYGCGPSYTLSKLLAAKGLSCNNYDPFYNPIELSKPYDFIFSTETFEHFHHPKQEIEKIKDLLTKGGVLTIMTDHWKTLNQFANWYYTRDITHVCFYHTNTIQYIISEYNFKLLYTDDERVVVLKSI